MSRGLCRLANLPPLSRPDLVTVALKIPRGVICLIAALTYHDLTTQIPHAAYVALPDDAEKPPFLLHNDVITLLLQSKTPLDIELNLLYFTA